MTSRLRSSLWAAAIAAVSLAAAPLSAQQLDRLQITAPASPGGGWDQTARAMQQALQAADIVPNVQVDNIPGAGGTIGLAQFVNNRAGDPNSLLIGGLVMVGAIQTNQSPVTLDQITPIARLTGEYEVIVVPADSPHQTMDDLVAALREDPGAVSWAGGSAGGTDHILVGLIAREVGVPTDQINYIPFSGGGEALAALLGGHVSAGVSGLGEFEQQIAAGQLRALAISAPERLEGVDVPTLREQGIDIDLVNWRGVVAPPNLTEEQRQALIQTVEAMATSEPWRETLEQRNWMDLLLTGDEFAEFLNQDRTRVEATLRDIGLVE